MDRAQKELNIEKQIKKIEDTWSVLALVFTPLPDSDVTALQVRSSFRQCSFSFASRLVEWVRAGLTYATSLTNAALLLVQIDDAITEALENDNLQLQNMSGQKYVQLNPMFQDAVANWQRKLGTVDSVLATWGDVQKKWQALESIFVGSADIRVQLPEDSKRFDVVNADYQVNEAHDSWQRCLCFTISCVGVCSERPLALSCE